MLNTNFSERAVVNTATAAWVQSPEPLVQRRLIERDGGEVARATSIVRYQAGASFNPHRHYGGEEIFVVDGVFEDEHGRYPAGSWLRNSHMSQHQPFSREGCTIFVKTGHLPVLQNTASMHGSHPGNDRAG